MSKEDLPVTPPPRPADPMTAADGMRLYSLIDQGLKRIEVKIGEVSNSLAVIQKQNIEQINLMRLIEAEFSDNRYKRLDLEIQEDEHEVEIAEARVRAAKMKLEKKRGIKDEGEDTKEKLKQAAATALSDVEETRKKKLRERIDGIKWALIQAIVITMGVGAALGLLRFLWYLFQLWQGAQGKP